MADANVTIRFKEEGATSAKAAMGGVESGVVSINQALEISKKAFDFIKSAFDSMSEKYASSAKLDAVLKSTGGAAGMTRVELDKLTGSLAGSTLASASMIREGEHMLLTFTQIGKEVFPQATETILNMAAAFGTDAKTSAVQLGKALNDPVNGMTALRRVGVTFSAEQKKSIRQFQEQGDLVSAQKVILKELGTEFGGLAKKMAETPTGRIEQFTKALGAAKAFAIDLVLKGLSPIISAMSTLTDWIRSGIEALGPFKIILGAVAGTIGLLVAATAAYTVWLKIAAFQSSIMAVVENGRKVVMLATTGAQWLYNAALAAYNVIADGYWIKTAAMAVAGAGVAIVQGVMTAAQWLLNIAMNANPIGIVITLLGLLGLGLAGASLATGDTSKKMANLWDTIKTVTEWTFRLLTPFGQMYTIGEQLYKKFPMVKAVFDSVWESLKAGYETLKKVYEAAKDFLGLSESAEAKAQEKAKEAAADRTKTLEQWIENEKSAGERNLKDIEIRALTENMTEKQKNKLLSEEKIRHNGEMWKLNAALGEDTREFELAGRQAQKEIRDRAQEEAKAAAEKRKKLKADEIQAEIDAEEDGETKAMLIYAKSVNELDAQLKAGEILRTAYNNRRLVAQRVFQDALDKIAEDKKKKAGGADDDEKLLDQITADSERQRKRREKEEKERRDSQGRATEISNSMLMTEMERIDAKAKYEKAKLDETREHQYMSDEEYNASSIQIAKQTADAKAALEIGMAKDVMSELGGMVDKNTALGQGVAYGQAVMNTYEGMTKALAQGGIFGPILAGIVFASGIATAAKIKTVTQPKARAQGGDMTPGQMYMTQEQGREFIVNAEATRKNYGLLSAINAGAKPMSMPQSPALSHTSVTVNGRLVANGDQLIAVIESALPAHRSSMA